jgi:outer membrane immunogenic protein
MKKILLGVVGLAAVSMAAPATAADLAARPYTKAPPPMMAAIYDWTGFYIGLNGGGGSAHKCWDITNNAGALIVPPFREGCHNATGGLAGGQIGYRWQAANWVFGVEAQGDWANFKGSNISLFNAAVTNQTKIDAFGLFTGQVGYAWNNVLWYVKGGGAVANDIFRGLVTTTNIGIDTVHETRWGGVVGTGFEYGFAPNWSVAFEYDHLFMGRHSDTLGAVGSNVLSRIDSIRQDVDMGTVRVNYRWGGPVIAKY